MFRRDVMFVSFGLLSCCLLCGCEPPADAYTKKPEVPYSAPVAAVRETKPAATSPDGTVEMIRVPARAGVSDPGRYDKNIATTPLTAHYSMQQQAIFEAAIPKALELFEGVRNRKPNSHQEFMREIIVKSNIRLPPLPPQYRYIYDPERGQLMVEYPRPAD